MKRFISVLMIVFLMAALLAGCNKSKPTAADPTPTAAPTATAAPTQAAPSIDDSKLKDPYNLPNDYSAYPAAGNPTIRIWWPIDAFQGVAIKDMNQHEVWKEIQKLTGVNVKFESPAVGQENESFNLMIASNDLPDVIVQADKYKGGISAGIADEVYIDLKETIDKYSPNYKKFRESDDMRRKTTMDDEGHVLAYYNLAPYSEWMWFGPLIKQEALDKTGLAVPETMAEWYTFLKKCQEVGYKQPFVYNSGGSGTIFTGAFNGAYGAFDWTFVNKEGKVDWGPMQPGMKDYLAEMAKWYKEGLINKDYVTADYNQNMSLATSSDCAVINDSPDTMWGVWKTDNNIDFVGAPYPVLNKGEKPMTTYQHNKNCGWPAAITTACKNVEAAARFLDFGYTKKGWELCNFGLEDRTHKINEKGMPYYPDDSMMYNDPDKIPLSNLVWKYKLHQGPFIREEHNSNPLLVAKGSYSGKIREFWQNGCDHSPNMPAVTLTSEESSREAELGTQLATLRSETFSKIIMGQQPVSTWDSFVEQAKKMGVEEFLSIWQAGLDRYNKR